MTLEEVGLTAALALGLLELIKLVVRLVVGKEYDFPPTFYKVAIPVLNVVAVPILAFLGFEGYAMPTDWQEWGMALIRVALSSLLQLVLYNDGVAKFKEYRKEYVANK